VPQFRLALDQLSYDLLFRDVRFSFVEVLGTAFAFFAKKMRSLCHSNEAPLLLPDDQQL
jgi:hypothetical protein